MIIASTTFPESLVADGFLSPDVAKHKNYKRNNTMKKDLVIVAAPHDVHPVAGHGACAQGESD